MKFDKIIITFGFMIIGYLIGSILNSVWMTKFLKIEDIRNKGSKNAGATNAFRVHGPFLGIMVIILDSLKTIVAMTIPFIAVGTSNVFLPAVGIASVIGHIFPVFHNFKGGKGAAPMLGFLIGMDWLFFFIGFAVFITVVKLTKKASLGSLVTPIILAFIYLLLNLISGFRSVWDEPLFNTYNFWSVWVSLWIIIIFVFIAHRENIKRLIKGKENSIIKKTKS